MSDSESREGGMGRGVEGTGGTLVTGLGRAGGVSRVGGVGRVGWVGRAGGVGRAPRAAGTATADVCAGVCVGAIVEHGTQGLPTGD